MVARDSLFLLLLLCAGFLVRAEGTGLSSAAALREFLEQGEPGDSGAFNLTGLVYQVGKNALFFQDESGRILIHERHAALKPVPGDRANICGIAQTGRSGEPWMCATNYIRLGRGELPAPERLTLDQLDERKHDLKEVLVEGTVMRTFNDDVDEGNLFLQIKDGDCLLPVAVRRAADFRPERLIDAAVRVRGIYYRTVNGYRKFSGPYIDAEHHRNVTVLSPAPDDPFAAPPLPNRLYMTPREIGRLGRRTVHGRVVATWGGNRLMLRETNGRTITIEMTDDEPLPRYGLSGTASGYPETDLYRLSLVSAIFRPDSAEPTPDDEPTDSALEGIRPGQQLGAALTLLHGRLIRTHGILRSIPAEGAPEKKLILDCGKITIAVDFSTNPQVVDGLQLGSTLNVTGRCLVECERSRADNIFPRIKDVTVILRTPADIKVLVRPPWWAPGRLLAVIGALLTSLIIVFIWNRVLRRLVDRRSRELFRSKAKNIEADVRLSERTRLAADLHDTISQMLTGASMRVDAASAFLATDAGKAQKCLGIAAKTLGSCKSELRSCIWDLRNRVLDEDRIEEAIRKTVQPILGKTRLSVDFDLPRSRVSDNTLHSVLCIIRELVANAIRHGQADAVSVRGQIKDGALNFSVADDGCGFDPDDRPGLSEGHFGLQGIDERIRKLDGDMKITSSPGTGTEVSLWIRSQP